MLVRVPGSQTMYVVDLVKCQQVRCLHLYRTSVLARTYRAVSLPPLSAVAGTPTGDLIRLAFATANEGYALVGRYFSWRLYKTMNGARSWQRVSTPPGRSVVGLTVSASSVYLATANCSGTDNLCRDYQLNRSTLLVHKWTSSTWPHPARTNVTDGEFSPNVGAWGSYVWISEITHAGSTIFTSHDQGRTFIPIRTNSLASVSGCAITAESVRSLWAECPTGMMVSFFHSSDGGVTWTNVPQRPFFGTGGGTFDPVSSSIAYLAYGATQPLVRIFDEGKRATTVGALNCSKVNSSIHELMFDDQDHGLAICLPGDSALRALLLKTVDGGAHWTRVPAN
jgi:hypothetical protein